MTVADALHRAAEAIRALPDRDLLELALRAEGPGPAPAPLVPAAAPAPPTAALRQMTKGALEEALSLSATTAWWSAK
ncbi:MAG: hypothetical protein IPG04_17180 [Polyangiaceae bacterium]|nr:hypothetical protein [Polyangiaceae bacterium]